MVSPAPVNSSGQAPPGQTQATESVPRMTVGSPAPTNATHRFLDTFGFHLLVVLLGIALAFM
jgi:hypothetical protein